MFVTFWSVFLCSSKTEDLEKELNELKKLENVATKLETLQNEVVHVYM